MNANPEGALGLLALGLPPSATAEDVEAAFRREAKRRHPDMSTGSNVEMIALQKARDAALAWLTERDRDRPEADAFAGSEDLPVGWRRSRRGNAYLVTDDGVVTVFRLASGPARGKWTAIIRGEGGVSTFAPRSWRTENAALEAVERERKRLAA